MLENLKELSKTMKTSRDDFYRDYQHMSKLDLIKMLDSTHKSQSESVVSPSPYMSIGPEGKTAEYLQLIGEVSPPTNATNFTLPVEQSLSEQIKVSINL